MAKEKTENQDKLLEDVLKQIEREYGKGSIMNWEKDQPLMLNPFILVPYYWIRL